MRKIRKGLLLIAIALAITFLNAQCSRGVTVVIRNLTAETLRNADVRYTGGTVGIGDLAPAQEATVNIKPRAESTVILRYYDAAGTERAHDADVYVEAGYTGTIEIAVRPNHELHVKRDVDVR